MKLIRAICLLLLCPALSLNTRQGYEGLEQKLKEVFTERTGILRQLSKTTKELDSIKGNLQTLKNDDSVAKKDVQRILELSHKQREEMKSLQTALQKQLDEATELAEKQQAAIKFLKMEMEKKTKIIKDLQQENKSLKNKLLSGNKLCDVHAEESKKIQAQLKELRYGKKDLIFKGQQLMDLEHKLTLAKEELEKAALDKESQLKALKDTVHICFSAVLHNQPTSSHRFPATPTHLFRYSSLVNSSRVTFQQPHAKDIPKVQRIITASKSPANIGVMRRESNPGVKDCQMEKIGGDCFQNQTETESSPDSKKLLEQQQRTAAQNGKSNAKPSDDREDVEGGSKNTKLHKNN
ncbi:leucine zipper protein 2 isoform X1 [Salmo salar]|uniref:Leucine zipper protein 2 isoform X1 n=2 Tax=Salmo salar TaxID=8030 RepID=A0A1S3PTJ0_SALSA|nr:leucine zipper protein 2-like isoform X1 [Salmo salar]|eukprot:XP_014030529.1 PREDICTED: leucine zipper protein 2-like isoform X1 [Salmo salar]